MADGHGVMEIGAYYFVVKICITKLVACSGNSLALQGSSTFLHGEKYCNSKDVVSINTSISYRAQCHSHKTDTSKLNTESYSGISSGHGS